ncbi:TPA: hypothetical protein DEP21_01275 [Patescibacteria group bacterium]|nr:hypothetical protein [Candidatus Gracilibacteria bacterium]
MSDFLQVFAKELSLKFEPDTLKKFESSSYENLKELLNDYVYVRVMAKLQTVDKRVLYVVMKDVYLYHIDMLWIKHIDEMEYLRDKVGLMGYAQIDPLVMYKKEAFDKFQTLLWRLKSDVTTYIANFDFTVVSQQSAPLQMQQENG